MTRKEIFAEINAMKAKITDMGVTITATMKEEITSKITQAFRDYKTERYEEIRKGLTRVMGAEKAEKRVSEQMKEYALYELSDKIAELANNFRMWWPKGSYRNILRKRQVRKEDTARDEELIKDLDRIISEKGYKDVPMLVDADKLSDAAYDQRCLIVADVFLAMLSLGYSIEELAE